MDKNNLENNITQNNIIQENKYDSSIITTSKFSAVKWNTIEKPLSSQEKKRNEIIINLGENINTNVSNINKTNMFTIGNYYYNIVKNNISELISLTLKSETNNNIENIPKEDKKNKKTPKVPKISSTIKAKLDSTQEIINKKLPLLIKILRENPENKIYTDLMINFNFIEFRIIILMKIIEYYTKTTIENNSINNINSIKEELILGSKKILSLLKNIKQNTNNEYENYFKKICTIGGKDGFDTDISDDMIFDFETKINLLIGKYGIKLIDIANTKPKLIYDTKYDETIPNIKMKPYDSQINLITLVKNNIENGFLLLYKTLPGLGKTSMILSICSYVKKSNSKIKIIFCCSDLLESVRVQVLRLAFNFNIKFGIATGSNKDDKFVITNSWNCPKDDDRELIVADYKSTYLILKENKNKYLLFFDEPTVLTDQIENTTTLTYLSQILYWLPSHVILSSATLPLTSEIDNIVEHFKNKYSDAVIDEVISNKTLIGSFIKDFNSNVIVPHSYCKNFSELSLLIEKIKKFPLLGKFYTLPFLMNLNNLCIRYDCGLVLDSIENFDHENILENILFLFENLINLNTNANTDADADIKNVFEEFINITVSDIQENNIDITKLDINDYNTIYPDKFLTSHAFKYLGCCLIANDDPLDYVKTHFYPIINKLKVKVGIDNINYNYELFLKSVSEYNQAVDRIKLKFTSDEKIDEAVEKLKVPKFEFVKALEVNSDTHIRTFAKYVKSYESSMLKCCVNPEKINITEFNIDDNLKFLLYMGIGIYSKNLDSDYTNKILEMLTDRELAFIIADESFCYGANYLISNVIIYDNIADNHSINTILQLIGRTARIGKSWSGKVYLDNNTSNRIKEFFINPTFNSVEGFNINSSFNMIKNKYEEELIPKINVSKIISPVTTISTSTTDTCSNITVSKGILGISNSAYEDSDIVNWKRGENFKAKEPSNKEPSNKEPLNKEENITNAWVRGSSFVKKTNTNTSTNTSSWTNIRGSNVAGGGGGGGGRDGVSASTTNIKKLCDELPNTATNNIYNDLDNVNMFSRPRTERKK